MTKQGRALRRDIEAILKSQVAKVIATKRPTRKTLAPLPLETLDRVWANVGINLPAWRLMSREAKTNLLLTALKSRYRVWSR